MAKSISFGLEEALKKTLESISPLGTETVLLGDAVDRIVAEDLVSKVDSPSIHASMKDGYAVRSTDLHGAAKGNPVSLRVSGCASAGIDSDHTVSEGSTVRILTGARIPEGADAVLAEEFVEVKEGGIVAGNDAGPGRNILLKGSDVAVGQKVVEKDTPLTPGLVGLLAAAGFGEVPVFRRPKVAVIATGDEVVAPGAPLPEGKLYASNMVTLCAFCNRYGMKTFPATAKDTEPAIRGAIRTALDTTDAVITSGGAWTGDRDLVAKILTDMGWNKVFHRVRIGPGKAVGFGILEEKPVFILPGGPPSNLMGFLQLALPGLMRYAGYAAPGLPTKSVRVASDLSGRDMDWTQFIFGAIENGRGGAVFHSLRQKSRLESMALATAVAALPEGTVDIPEGEEITVQLLS